MKTLTTALILSLAVTACAIEDADLLATPALTVLDASATTDQLTHRSTTIKGTLTLGYTGQQLVTVRILDNGVPVHASSLAADALSVPFEATIDLLSGGANELTVEATYNGQTVQKKLSATVPAPLHAFTFAAAASRVAVFSSGFTGQITFGHFSPALATLELQVEGATVYSASIDVSTSLTAPIAATLPLARVGSNAIVAIVRYQGAELSARTSVEFAWDAPVLDNAIVWGSQVLVPATANEAAKLTLSGTADLTGVNPGYTLDAVRYATDGGPFAPAPKGADGKYSFALVNPDLGIREVTVEVVTSNDGRTQTTVFKRPTPAIRPVFDCNASSSMLPVNNLISNNALEYRSLVGYFGNPASAHVLAFSLTGPTRTNGVQDTVVGRVLTAGSTTTSVEFNVNPFRCNMNNNNSCSVNYALEFAVDGIRQCISNQSFGTISTFN